MNGISVENLCIKRGNREILSELTFSVPFGNSICVLGKSGSGKSTLIKALTGFLKPSSGKIFIHGNEVKFGKMLENASIVFQECALFDDLTVSENILFGLRCDSKNADSLLEEVLESVGLKTMFTAYHPDELSGGMKKKVALARALIRKPKLLIMDEPTSGFDPVNSEKIVNLIQKLKHEWGVSILLITHDPSTALRLTDFALFIHEGKSEFQGATSDILHSPSMPLKEFLKCFKDCFNILIN